VLHHRIVTIVFVLAVLGSSCILVPMIGTELMPASDEGELRINLEQAVGTESSFVNETVVITEPIIKEIPGLVSFVSFAG